MWSPNLARRECTIQGTKLFSNFYPAIQRFFSVMGIGISFPRGKAAWL